MESAPNVDISKFVELHDVEDYKLGVEERLGQDHLLLKMLEEGLHADVTLVAQGVSVKAHRCVLASRSPVFCAMFQSEMKEQRLSTVDIPDMTLDGLQLFLLVLYTANETCHNEDGDKFAVTELYTAAIDRHFGEFWQANHKYQTASGVLQSVLVSALRRNLTPENCWYWYDCLLHVDGRTREFSDASYEFILDNYKQVIISGSLLVEMRRNPDRVHEFMRTAATLDLSATGAQTYLKRRI